MVAMDQSAILGLDKQIFLAQMCQYFITLSFTYVLDGPKNRLIETVLLNTHNICFG